MGYPITWPLIWAAATDAASSGIALSTVLNVVWCVFLVLIGVNMLIIVHEFGHFIVARMCGVRCDKFYIWFDIYGWKLFKFKWGDTEYGLGVLPLGGYVKMLGQEDSPGAIKAEIERAKQASEVQSAECKAQSENNNDNSEQIAQLEQSLYAKDSYLAKSIPQRMAIIVAGVMMNVIFAFICGVGAYTFGLKEESPIIGNTAPGSNAWAAGLQPGDRVLSVDGRPVRKFSDIRTSIIRTSKPESDFVIERPGTAEPIELKIAPTKTSKALMATIGIVNDRTLTLADPVVYPWIDKTDETKKLKPGDTLVAVNGEQVNSFAELQNLQTKWRNEPLAYSFRRQGSNEPVSITLPPMNMMNIMNMKTLSSGIAFEAGKVVKTQSQAAVFGFEEGDVLVSLDGETIDALRLPMQIYDKSQTGGGTVTFVVKRHDEKKILEVDIPADGTDSHLMPSEIAQYACSDILGIVYQMTNITDFGELDKITLHGETPDFLKDIPFGKKVENGFEISNSDSIPNFTLFIYGWLFPRLKADSEVMLTFKSQNPKEVIFFEIPFTVQQDQQWTVTDRGLLFEAATFNDKAESFGQALAMGADATVQNTLLVYYTVEQLLRNFNGTGRVSPKGLGGPILIVQAAYSFANSGIGKYLFFLCMLSANLAVLNILPIPVLDGGHIVFLTYEAIFRKPPNETVQVILSYMGLLLLLALMVWVFALDLGFIKRF
ncbi:MAG: site-2 protease family protein [Planctomycetaceae bacterium]|nr:site-2 protease family protein [Planctomycetaceae bacterium]